MPSSVQMKYRPGALYDLRRLAQVVDLLETKGQSITDDANQTLDEGEGYRLSSRQGRRRPQGRWAVRIYTASPHARYSNAKHNTLVRLLNSAKNR